MKGKGKAAPKSKTVLEVPASATASSEGIAELFGVHPKTVAAWIKDGMPVARRTGRSNAIDIGVAIRWVRERDAAAHEKAMDDVQSSPQLDSLRARKLEAESRIAEAEADQVEGRLVLAADVVDRLSRVAMGIREGVLNLPAQAVQVGLVSPDREEEFDDLCREALRDLTKLEAPPDETIEDDDDDENGDEDEGEA